MFLCTVSGMIPPDLAYFVNRKTDMHVCVCQILLCLVWQGVYLLNLSSEPTHTKLSIGNTHMSALWDCICDMRITFSFQLWV